MPRLLFGLALVAVLAHAERLVFTTLAPTLSCPVVVSAPERSSDFGFQSLLVHNDSDRSVRAVYLTVTFYTPKTRDREVTVDSGHVYVELEPGEQKRLDVFLGRIQALSQKLKSAGEEIAWVKLAVDAAEFSDGSRWDGNQPATDPTDLPIEPSTK